MRLQLSAKEVAVRQRAVEFVDVSYVSGQILYINGGYINGGAR